MLRKRRLVQAVGDGKSKDQALNVRGDKFTTAVRDLFGKGRTGKVLLSKLADPSPHLLIYCLCYSGSLKLSSEIGVCSTASAPASRRGWWSK